MVIKVDGMSCNHCKMRVEKVVKNIEFVEDASVSLENKEVSITFKPGKEGDVNLIKAAISDAGYDPQ
ncbi:MAG: heavy-metal-associated domain-containing protein [Pleomorphochaeta sp.]